MTKRLRFHNEDAPTDDEFLEVSINIVDGNTGKQRALEPENSATPSVYVGTCSRSGTTRPINYKALAQGKEKPKDHSAIVDSQSSSSSDEKAVHSFVADSPEEIAQQLAM